MTVKAGNLNLRAWRRRSKLQRTEYPLCWDHLQRGEYVPATEVHHVHSRRSGGDLFSDELLSLCHACHSHRTNNGE